MNRDDGAANPIVYVAHPLDYAGVENNQVPLMLERALRDIGFCVYDPGLAWHTQGAPRREIEQVNIAALGRAHGVVAWLPDGIRTIGVPMEIERAAHNLGIPVAIIGGGDILQSWALAGQGRRVQRFGESHTEISMAVAWLRENISTDEERIARLRRVKVAGDGPLPTKTYETDVGWDLYYSGDMAMELKPGEARDVPAGIRIEWPEGMWALVVGRSSTFKRGLLCSVGIIDPGYRGDYFAVLHNIGRGFVRIQPGERIAQAIPFHNAGWSMSMERMDELSRSERGERGFGSSGR